MCGESERHAGMTDGKEQIYLTPAGDIQWGTWLTSISNLVEKKSLSFWAWLHSECPDFRRRLKFKGCVTNLIIKSDNLIIINLIF